MGLLSKLKSGSKDAPAARAGASPADASEIVRDARTKARRRLIGAALLLGVGIIGFPLLFETQPRPIAVDIPIEIPSRESAPPLVSPASRPARNTVAALPKPPVEPPASVATEPPRASAPTENKPAEPASAAAPKPAEPKPAAPKPVEAKPAEPKPVPAKPAEAKPAEAKPTPKPAEATKPDDAAKDDGRYVVQIGAFAEATGAREARAKVEGMGLKTYTQVIESDSGRRIRVRVGPYATKAEADKAAAKIKAGGLQAAVLKL
ncbi:MAG: SPOR domain-containing protein [Burkholderiaceae bacterium]